MIRTRWGYSVDADELPPIIGVDDFIAMTGDAFDPSDPRIEPTLDAASSAIRNACGWHVAPSLSCECDVSADGTAFALPAMGVTSVESIEIGGATVDPSKYEWCDDGMVRSTPYNRWPHGWRSIHVAFVAGFDADATADLAAIVAQVASNNLAAAPGVRREQAGGVSIDYNSNGSGGSGGISLLERDRALLAPYKMPPVPA